MEAEHKVGAVQLGASLRRVSPPVTRRLRVAERTWLADLHAARCKSTSAGAMGTCIPFRSVAGSSAIRPR